MLDGIKFKKVNNSINLYEANILIVDDEPVFNQYLEKILRSQGYQYIQSVTDSRQVIGLCQKQDFDAILLDIRMPFLDGYALLNLLQQQFEGDYLPVLVLTASLDRETRLNSLQGGAKDFITKPIDPLEVLTRMKNLLEIRLMHNQIRDHNKILEEKVKHRKQELYATRLEVIRRLGLAGEYRANDTSCHIIRMSKFAYWLAKAYGLSESEAEMILHASPMHDIGNLGIPDEILLKPRKLQPNEWDIVKRHVEIGGEILSNSTSSLMTMGKQIVLHHHEKWDGTGYPFGLRGTEISIEGRICALADVFDVLTSKRSYKEAWSVENTIAYIEEQSGKHFDPDLAPLVRQLLPQFMQIKAQYQEPCLRGQQAVNIS